jgi:DNA-binding transcriptional LysR family regulator
MTVTIRQLLHFNAVAQVGSFTRAAERLKIAQPALSLSIRELEGELRVRLFDRTTRRVELTDAGRNFLQATERLTADLDNAVRNVRDLSERKHGRIVLAAPPFLAAMIAPPAIAEYKRRFAGVEIHLIEGQSDDIVEKIRSGQADCGVGTFPIGEEGIRRDNLFTDELMAWCSARSQIAKSGSLRWSEIKTLPLISLTRSSTIRTLVDSAVGPEAKRAYEVSHMTTAVMLAEAGLGIAVLPAYVWGFARAFSVVPRYLVEPQIRRDVSFIYASHRALSPAAEGFFHVLRKHARAALPTVLRGKSARAGV